MSNELAPTQIDTAMLEKVIVGGNLESLSPGQRLDYYAHVCESIGLNPLTKPFQYIKFQGNLTLYAGRNCTDQLAKIHGISLEVGDGQDVQGAWVVKATAIDASGRKADALGAVSLGGLKGEALANALMKAETKAKRRAVLSFTGLSMLDETEAETIEGAREVQVDDGGAILPPASEYGTCEWHTTPFTGRTRQGTAYHKAGPNFCNGKRIVNPQGEAVVERGMDETELELEGQSADASQIGNELAIDINGSMCVECEVRPALPNGSYCQSCEGDLFGDQQGRMIDAPQEVTH